MTSCKIALMVLCLGLGFQATQARPVGRPVTVEPPTVYEASSTGIVQGRSPRDYNVPDAGSSMLLLGSAFSVLVFARLRRR